MKTSNKILLGVFLAVLLLITTVNLIVYAKYKRGEFEPFQREPASSMSKIDVPAASFVSLTGLGSIELINSDTARFETPNDKLDRISYRMVKDTLVILGDASATEDRLRRGSRNYQTLRLYLPASIPVRTSYSGIMVRGKTDSTKAPSFNVQVVNDSYFSMTKEGDENVYIKQLVILGSNSGISLEDNVVISDLNLSMFSRSRFDGKLSEIKKLTLDMNGGSTINLSDKSIKALK